MGTRRRNSEQQPICACRTVALGMIIAESVDWGWVEVVVPCAPSVSGNAQAARDYDLETPQHQHAVLHGRVVPEPVGRRF